MKRVLPIACLAVVIGSSFALTLLAQDDKPKYTVKEVMDKAHKQGLLGKVTKGEASKEDKTQLVELYTALGKNKVTKGGEASWKEKTDALLAAAKEAAEDKAGAADKLKKASNCKDCHSVHK